MISSDNKFYLNRMNSHASKVQLGTLLDNDKNVAVVDYNFATLGGAVSTIDLSKTLPANAFVTKVYAEELTDVTSGGSATVTLYLGSTALTGAIAIAAFTGITAPALAGSAAAIKVAAESNLKVAIAVAALTAGKVRFHVEYHVSATN